MAPGIRFAFGDRLGSPAAVSPPEDGESTVPAARQPSSAGDAQPLPATAVGPDRPCALLLPLNQFDSTASNMGNLCVCSGSSAGGTTTLPSSDGRPVRRVLSVMSPAASSPKTRSGWPEAPAYSPIPADSLGPGLLTAGTRIASDFNRRPGDHEQTHPLEDINFLRGLVFQLPVCVRHLFRGHSDAPVGDINQDASAGQQLPGDFD
jgi:hypothetical protein